MLSRANRAMIEFRARGYSVHNGDVFAPDGQQCALDIDRKGYKRFSVRYEGRTVSISVHRFVAYMKFGDALFVPGVEVRHLNGNAHDNHEQNIAIGTHSQNMLDRSPEARRTTASRAARKLSDAQLRQLHADRASGMKYADLCEKYGMTKSSISYIINKQKRF